MRPLLGTLAALVLTLSASAEVAAGRTHILFHDAWTPLSGAALTPLGLPVESVAFDGEHFLLAWRDTEAVRLGLFEEGATTPLVQASLEAAPGKPFVRWDGSRYVVIVASEPAQLAIVSRQGVVELRTTIPRAYNVVDAAASPYGIVLAATYPTTTHAGVVEVMLLDSEYRIARTTLAGSILRSTGFGGTYIGNIVLTPFGDAFYVAWEEGRTARWDDVVGTRVLLDGSAPDVVPSRHEQRSVTGTLLQGTSYVQPNPYTVALHPWGSRMAVVSVREYGYGVNLSSVDLTGTASPATFLYGLFYPMNRPYSVRLLDGTLVMVSAKDGVATVKPLIAVGPHRRSSRH